MVLICNNLFGQIDSKDLSDILRPSKNKKELNLTSELQVGKTYSSVLPFAGYGPANGFVLGAAMSISRNFGQAPTNPSSSQINCQVTTMKQFITNIRSELYLEKNKWYLQGDWRLLFFSQPTYGLGIVDMANNEEIFTVNQLSQNTEINGDPMKFNLFRFHEDAAVKMGDSHFYAGMGVSIDQHFDIVDENLDTIVGSPDYYITPNYAYSVKNNFDPVKYGTNGVKLTLLTDTRDNTANSYKGYFASASMLYNIKIGNNSQQSYQLLYDARYYLGLSSVNKRKVLAFWSWGSFLLHGNLPYLALPSISWDTYNRSGRGFIQGRYRGLSMVYSEVEYRFPISKRGLFGGDVFLNTTNASSYSQKLFDKTAVGVGGGIRLQMEKQSRTNLGMDIGIGSDHSYGLYFNLQETF